MKFHFDIYLFHGILNPELITSSLFCLVYFSDKCLSTLTIKCFIESQEQVCQLEKLDIFDKQFYSLVYRKIERLLICRLYSSFLF